MGDNGMLKNISEMRNFLENLKQENLKYSLYKAIS